MTLFHVIAIAALLLLAGLLFLVLAEPGLTYRVAAIPYPLESHAFLGLVAALVDTQVFRSGRTEVLSSGKAFYAAELDAIGKAAHSVHIEAYLFLPSPVAARFLDILIERARNGVRVRLVIDAIGSLFTPDHYFAALRAAGGRVVWYQPIRWYTLKRFNNRTHRELIIVDVRISVHRDRRFR